MTAATPHHRADRSPLQARQYSQVTRRFRGLMAGSVFLLTLIVNYLTMAPTVTLVDSGELIVAAKGLGVAHPPGFPLYCLLAHLATRFPLGNIAERVNFASGLFAALTAATVTLIAAELIFWGGPRVSGKEKFKSKKGEQADAALPLSAPAAYLYGGAPCVFAGLSIAFSRTLWGYATIAEVYTLNSFLITMILLLMLRWRRAHFEIGRPAREPTATRPELQATIKDAYLYAAALLFGVALGVHHVTVGLMLPGLAALVYGTEGIRFFKSKRLLIAALVSIAGLIAVYSYLPLAARRGPVLNWGDPTTLSRIWLHISGWQYRVFLQFSAGRIGDMTWEFLRFYAREFGPVWFPLVAFLGAFGLIHLYRSRQTAAAALLSAIIAADMAYGLSYEIAEDKDAYYLPLLIATAILAGTGAEAIVHFIRRQFIRLRWGGAAAAVLVSVLPIVTLAANLPYNDRSRYYIAHDYVDNILSTVEAHGTLLSLDWQVYSPLMYVREVEHVRTDVVAIDVNLLRRSWYYGYLRREYPDLMDHTGAAVNDFLEDLTHWEMDPDAYKTDASLNQRINDRFNQMIMAFVGYQSRQAPVYVTLDIAANLSGENPDLIKSINRSYQLVPAGLVFRLATDRAFHEPPDPQLKTRGLFDKTLAFDSDDVVRTKVIPVYLNMLVDRGRYFAAYGQFDRAIEAYRSALDLEPDFQFARQSWTEASSAKDKANHASGPVSSGPTR